MDHNDGKFLRTMEWLMVFVKVPLESMVFQCFFLQLNHWCRCFFNGFSHSDHRQQWFFNGFLTIEALVSMVFQCFITFGPSFFVKALNLAV